MASPDHNETLDIASQIGQTYAVTGYAYTGGGRKITRVEVSTDNGTHWELATLHRKEQPTEHGMHWCWVWWTYELPVRDLVGCNELICRAWDESNNAQPMNPTWNLMGMGHNPVFRVKVHCDKIVDDDNATNNNSGGRHVFRFEHPTQPGQQTGGWMTRAATKPDSAGFGRLLEQGDVVAAAAGAPAAAPPPPGSSSTGRRFTLAEVQKHDKEDDCWIIVKDRVYDATEYLELHPGGIESITMNAGMDATEDFVAIHSTKATKMLEKYYIGDLDKTSVADQAQEQQAELPELVDEQGRQLALHPRKKVSLRLQNKIVLSRDSFLLDFALPTPGHVLGLPTGKHVFMSASIGGETVLRRYTPISSNYDVGCVKFVIKCYRPCERFPDGGKMTQHIDKLDIGDYLDFKGPVGEFEYLRDGRFRLEGVDGECRARCYNMLAGGTGITPCMQIAAEILRHPHDTTKMSLIFACRVEEDLLMRSTLDEWAAQFPDRFRVHYILSDAWSKDWQYSTGFVDQPLFAEHLYPAADDVYNLMCGPPVMLQKSCVPNLEALGHQKSRIFSF